MKYVQINAYGYGSTGSIMRNIHKERLRDGDESYIAWARGPASQESNEYRFGTKFDVYMHVGLHRLFGMGGFMGSKRATEQLVSWLEGIDPDVVHLHNLHGYTIHLPVLFDFLKRAGKQVVWTLHDCWAFTGHCGHFSHARCSQWKMRCGASCVCPQAHENPKTLAGTWAVRRSFDIKRDLFTSLHDVEIIVPSQWLAHLVSQSYLSKYPIQVVPHKVDSNVFKATQSGFREQYGLEGKVIILGVASPWSRHKGLERFVSLSNLLDERFAIVLVGLTDKQQSYVQKSCNSQVAIVSLSSVSEASKLAQIYSASDYYWNASTEETFGMTTLEAVSCGAFSIVCEGTPGEEIISAETGVALPANASAVAEYVLKNQAPRKEYV
ncbi:glycosyltransferase [Rubneribacter sp.]|nr:glycosyltransferase [Candidatus Rubneribacter avistercoris]